MTESFGVFCESSVLGQGCLCAYRPAPPHQGESSPRKIKSGRNCAPPLLPPGPGRKKQSLESSPDLSAQATHAPYKGQRPLSLHRLEYLSAKNLVIPRRVTRFPNADPYILFGRLMSANTKLALRFLTGSLRSYLGTIVLSIQF